MNPEDMTFNELYQEMVRRGILPPGRTYIEGKERQWNENHRPTA